MTLRNREIETGKLCESLESLYGDISNLHNYLSIIKTAYKDGVITLEEKMLLFDMASYRNFRYN